MSKINLLPQNVAELIAAGEVVERPASVIKELVENSIDAGADIITVEIKRGGITYIRVTDNGCGIEHEDVPTAFLRHATSKIRVDDDLNAIGTLGFRGEALAAVSSVARVEMFTFTGKGDVGTHYAIEGGVSTLYEESGCPKGTTITIRDIFYNTPARMKFLKKDVSEGNACSAVVERIALSHPEISFKFIRDGKQTLLTSGDGDPKSAVYSLLGRDFSAGLIEAAADNGRIKISGLITKPVFCKPTRNYQFTFLNGRLVRSGTVIAAVEQAYKNSAMVGKFPGFVLYITVPFDAVDVNVHPAKTEVRFADEKSVFDAVYYAVKNAITVSDTRPQVKIHTPTFNKFEHMTAAEYRQQTIPAVKREEKRREAEGVKIYNDILRFETAKNIEFVDKITYVAPDGSETKPMTHEEKKAWEASGYKEPEREIKAVFEPKPAVEPTREAEAAEERSEEVDKIPQEPQIIYIGEAFSTYIVVQKENSIFLIDKHAAHERIIFNRLKRERKTEIQPLLMPAAVSLASEEYDAVISGSQLLAESGFELEDFGSNTVMVRAIPAYLAGEDVASVISEAAQSLISAGKVENEKEENLLHTIACRAAIKAGNKNSDTELSDLAKQVLGNKDIMYCPHGRPVAFEIKKRELEKQFGRIQ